MLLTLVDKLLETHQLGLYQRHIVDCVSWSKMLHRLLRTKYCYSLMVIDAAKMLHRVLTQQKLLLVYFVLAMQCIYS